MTDKQIIIDGVDVNGCEFYFNGCCGINGYFDCIDTPNCVYKQLKCKEQEYEELKKWLPIVARLEERFKSHEKAKGIDYQTYTEQVFTELDQLKEELQEIREEFGIETLYWKDPNERPHRTHRSLKFLKLKQALTEIEEIAKPQTYYRDYNQKKTATELVYDYANIVWNLEQKMHKILQKISEVIDE